MVCSTAEEVFCHSVKSTTFMSNSTNVMTGLLSKTFLYKIIASLASIVIFSRKCNDGIPLLSPGRNNQENGTCNQTPDPGTCFAAFTRWYYDAQEQNCKQFTWGGCGGNDNNFDSFDECMDACRTVEAVEDVVTVVHHTSESCGLVDGFELPGSYQKSIVYDSKCLHFYKAKEG